MKTITKIALVVGVILSLALTSCTKKESKGTVLKLGVVGSIYEDLWNPTKVALKAQGIDLQIVQFSDYVTPNNALANKEIDLNAFQHRIFLQKEKENCGYKIEIVGDTFIIPMNLYSAKVKSVSELKAGSVVAIPNDVTNGGRALKVLAAAGLIKLKSNAPFNPSLDDIETYNNGIKIKELAANAIPSALPDLDAAIVNGNYALDFGLKTEEAIYKDNVLSDKEYWNLIAARREDVANPERKALIEKVVKTFQTDVTKKVFNEKIGGYFIAVGW